MSLQCGLAWILARRSLLWFLSPLWLNTKTVVISRTLCQSKNPQIFRSYPIAVRERVWWCHCDCGLWFGFWCFRLRLVLKWGSFMKICFRIRVVEERNSRPSLDSLCVVDYMWLCVIIIVSRHNANNADKEI